jgi:hypothetical protein
MEYIFLNENFKYALLNLKIMPYLSPVLNPGLQNPYNI